MLGTTIKITWCISAAVYNGGKHHAFLMDASAGKEKRHGWKWAMKVALSQSLMALWRVYILNLHIYISHRVYARTDKLSQKFPELKCKYLTLCQVV